MLIIFIGLNMEIFCSALVSIFQSNGRFLTLSVNMALIFLAQLPLVAEAEILTQTTRWVLADEVRVREQPNLDGRVIGTLSRGAELVLKSATEAGGFCQIEGEGQYGYVACKYLSAQRISRRKAGEDGIDAAQRWVSGSGVTLREAPTREANIIARLGVSSIVKFLREEPKSGYCEVQTSSGSIGFTACRYLADTPLVLANINGTGMVQDTQSPGYDPERLFRLDPSWAALYQYAMHLKKRHPDIPPQGPWPKDDALERMKVHLALGLNGPKPKPYTDWSELKLKAAEDIVRNRDSWLAEGKNVPEKIAKPNLQTRQIAHELQGELGLWGHISTEGDGPASIIRLVSALDFNKIQPSLFRSEAELATPSTLAEAASGRFGIVFRQVVTPRAKPKTGDEYLGL
jgi:SH3-like domain-containing protein